jgi:hypothetical protein
MSDERLAISESQACLSYAKRLQGAYKHTAQGVSNVYFAIKRRAKNVDYSIN